MDYDAIPDCDDQTCQKTNSGRQDLNSRSKKLKRENSTDAMMADQTVSFEHILDVVGSQGKWQIFLFVLTSLSGFFNAFHHMGSMFLAATPDHWCAIPGSTNETVLEANNWTDARVKEYAIPRDSDGDYSSCDIYNLNYTSAFSQPWSPNSTNHSNSDDIEKCDSWVYDKSFFESTVVTQYGLVCSQTPLASTIQAIYMVGVFFGTLIFGLVSDRFGRRKAVLIAVLEFIASGLLASIPVHYVWFTTFRLLTGMGAGGCFTATYVLMAEFISPNMRDVAGIAFQIPFGIGYMVLPGIAYLIRTWNWLQLAISLIDLVLLSYIWLLPESPRWLISNGKIDSALPILKRVAKFNGIKGVTDKELIAMMDSFYKTEMDRRKGKLQQPSNLSILVDLFRTPQMRKRILVSYFIWMAVSLCYYGLSFKAPSMGNNIYLVAFLTSLTEIPSYIIGCVIIRYLSRKLNIIGSFIIGGVACLVILAVPSGHDPAVAGLAIGGKFFINIAYAIVYLYTTEIFPTGNRNIALGTSSMSARIGATVAPFINDLLGGNIPLIIFGVASCVAGILCLLLPETKDRYMPETITDIELSRTTTTESLNSNGVV